MKFKYLFIILLLFLFAKSFCQNENDKHKQYNSRNKIGKSELEFTLLGIGFNRIWEKTNYSYAFGVNIRYTNIILYTNNTDFYEFWHNQNRFIDRLGSDYIKIKYSLRKNIYKNFEGEFSIFSSLAFIPENEEGEYFPGFGIEAGLRYFNFRRIKFSSSIYFTKSFIDKNIYLQLIPVKIIFKLNKHENET